jgi:hypothetical protein
MFRGGAARPGSLTLRGERYGPWTLGLEAAVWLAVGSLAAWGARRRGQRWRLAWLSGLLFPLSWVAWYMVDEAARRGGSAARPCKAIARGCQALAR